jgi:magnesium-transporting ATPase (P-type)
LQIFAAKSGFLKSSLVASAQDLQLLKAGVRYIHVQEHQFDSDSKRMSVVYHDLQTQSNVLFMKGAPECVLDACCYDTDGKLLSEENKATTLRLMENFAGEGLVGLSKGLLISASTCFRLTKLERGTFGAFGI